MVIDDGRTISHRFEWPFSLTRFEYEFLTNLNRCWKYIARDANNCLYVYSVKPKKLGYGWLVDDLRDEQFIQEYLFLNSFFNFVRHENEEPYKIDWLLENCEVEEKWLIR